MNVIRKKALGLVVVALFLTALAGTATAASLDLPKWVIVPEDSQFSDVTLFCGLDAYQDNGNGTGTVPCLATNLTIGNVSRAALVTGKIGNAVKVDGAAIIGGISQQNVSAVTLVIWAKIDSTTKYDHIIELYGANSVGFWIDTGGADGRVGFYIRENDTHFLYRVFQGISPGWHMFSLRWDGQRVYGYVDLQEYLNETFQTSGAIAVMYVGMKALGSVISFDEARWYVNRVLSNDELKLLYLAGRKKLSEPANFRQIFSPMIDLTRDRATFYAGLEVSTSDPSGYVPVPESATNMSITTAEKLTSDYTGAPFYYEGHFWYQAQDIQYSLPIQFETVRQDGNFSHTVLLDEDKKTFVYEKEFKVTNPTGARINVVYEINPLQLGFSALQYPQFELDGVRMVSWRPNNSSTPLLIATDTLEPGEVSTHWIKSTWTITKEELNFPAKLDDFRSISNWTVARKLAENAAEGKVDTYVRVIKIDSTADMSNMTVLVPLKDVKDENDVIEATAITGARDTLQVEKLSDGKVVVKVPGQDFVSGHAEIKVLYNKSGGSWFSQLLEKIRSLMKKILSMFGLGGG